MCCHEFKYSAVHPASVGSLLTKIAKPVIVAQKENLMPTQNVNLTDTLDAFVKAQVSMGHYNNASEVHRSALAAMARAEEERNLRIEKLKHEIQLGIDDVEAGRAVELRCEAELAAMLDRCLNEATGTTNKEITDANRCG